MKVALRSWAIKLFEILTYPLERLRGYSWFRRLETLNFSTGYVALGEQNTYGIPGKWITVDFGGKADFTLNMKEHPKLPFKDSSQKVVYSSHMVEHIDEASLKHLLKEAYRILKPGGIIRIDAPDAEKIFESYKQGKTTFFDRFRKENTQSYVHDLGLPPLYVEDHITMIGLLSCYRIEHNGRYYHMPVIADKATIDEHVQKMTAEEFGDWCVSLQNESQRKTGGHINPITFRKMKNLLSEANLKDVQLMESRSTRARGLSLRGIERRHRAFCSLIVEATK